ncbi:hypothetical protein PINS_up010341 [Pythium insidiosum]|nr:hypothetical protein PINS_up010341 [Pythium insidiosum]
MTRGVSGGERKRVTIGEMAFGDKPVMLMDEITTGLDSAAALDIVDSYRQIATTHHKTIVMSLLQPSPEIFALFDDVILLNKGFVLYHGPRTKVLPYFQSLGLECPPTRDEADFLLDLGKKQQQQYERGQSGSGLPPPRSAEELAAAFERSPVFSTNMIALAAPFDASLQPLSRTALEHVPVFHQAFLPSTLTVLHQQARVTMRNRAVLIGRAIMVVIVGLLYSTVFWQFDPKDVQVVMGIIFNSVLFVGIAQASQIAPIMASRQVFYKQRQANFYRTPSYVIAWASSQLPVSMIETIAFGSLVYWMCGFVSDIGAYILFLVLLLATNVTFSSWFFFIGSISPNLNVAQPIAMLSIMIFALFSGFVITRDQIPAFISPVYWINPMSWCFP